MVLAEEAPADFGSDRTPSRRTKRCLQDESVWRTFDDARDVVKREVAVTRSRPSASALDDSYSEKAPAAGGRDRATSAAADDLPSQCGKSPRALGGTFDPAFDRGRGRTPEVVVAAGKGRIAMTFV